MSYPDPTQPPHPLIPPTFSGDPAASFSPPFWAETDHHHQSPPDPTTHFNHHPFKRPRPSSENLPNPRVNPPNTPGGKGTGHIFFKTRICAKFMDGTCKNGPHCTFAHGPDDLREPPPNWQDIVREKDRASGARKNRSAGSENEYHRPTHRVKICNKYYNGEECPYGDRCSFLHERGPAPVFFGKFKAADVAADRRESLAISVGVEGRGIGGGDFDQRAFWKTRVCSKWETGNCPFGDRCHYAHGQSEQVMMSVSHNSSIPRNSGFSTPPDENEIEKKAAKWKITKKLNGIYADWLDDEVPPHCDQRKQEEGK